MTSAQEVWEELLRENQLGNGRPVGRWGGGVIVASLSAAGLPELIIQLANWDFNSLSAVPGRLRLRGFDTWYQVLRVGYNQTPCFILKPRSIEENEMFFAIANHLVSTLPDVDGEQVGSDAIERVIEAWAEAWKKVHENPDRKRILGLIGELLAIERWIDKSAFDHSNWQGPKGGPHDFCGETFDVEVKTSGSRTGPLKHEISSIHQLENQEGRGLYVLSFRIGLSKTAELSVSDLVSRVAALPAFSSRSGSQWLEDALRDAGYSPQLDAEMSRFNLWEECLFEVREGFPRLKRAILPNDLRIFDLTYSVNFGGCQEFVVSTEPISLVLAGQKED